MRRFLILFTVFVLLTAAISGAIKLDVKTDLYNKFHMRTIKYGVIFSLKNLGYEIVEFGEDYSVWLSEGVTEKLKADSFYKISLNIRIKPPVLFLKNKPILAGKRFEFIYRLDKDLVDINNTGFFEFVGKKIKSSDKRSLIEAYKVGKRVAEEIDILVADIVRN